MCITGKRKYDKQGAKSLKKKHKFLKRYYRCDFCGWYHLTTQSMRRKRNTRIKDLM